MLLQHSALHVQVGGHAMLMQQQGIPGQSGHPGQLDNQQLLQNSQLQNAQLQNSQLGYYMPQQQPQQQQLTPHQQQETYQQNWQLGQTLSQQSPLGLSSGLTYVGASLEVESALKAAHEAYRKSEFMQALQLCHTVRCITLASVMTSTAEALTGIACFNLFLQYRVDLAKLVWAPTDIPDACEQDGSAAADWSHILSAGQL